MRLLFFSQPHTSHLYLLQALAHSCIAHCQRLGYPAVVRADGRWQREPVCDDSLSAQLKVVLFVQQRFLDDEGAVGVKLRVYVCVCVCVCVCVEVCVYVYVWRYVCV